MALLVVFEHPSWNTKHQWARLLPPAGEGGVGGGQGGSGGKNYNEAPMNCKHLTCPITGHRTSGNSRFVSEELKNEIQKRIGLGGFVFRGYFIRLTSSPR